MLEEVQESYMTLFSKIVALGDSVSTNLKNKINEASAKMAEFGKKEIVFLGGFDWKQIRD